MTFPAEECCEPQLLVAAEDDCLTGALLIVSKPTPCDDDQDENDQLKKLQRWFQEQQPKLQNVKTRILQKIDSTISDSSTRDVAISAEEKMIGNDDDSVEKVQECPSLVNTNAGDETIGESSDDNVFMMTREEGKALARKVGCAVVGGSLIVVGIPLIPLPGPGDFMVVGGFAVLATEFDAARRVLDGARDKLVEVLDGKTEEEQSDDTVEENEEEANDEKEMDTKEDENVNSVPYNNKNGGIDVGGIEIDVEGAVREVKKQAERLGRNVVLPLLDTVCSERTTGEEGQAEDDGVEECSAEITLDEHDASCENSGDTTDSQDITNVVATNFRVVDKDDVAENDECSETESEEWEVCKLEEIEIDEEGTETGQNNNNEKQEEAAVLVHNDEDDISL